MSLDTVTLQCFLAVADTGSFTKAADRVGRTQSAISQQIAKLENLVGKTLFNRGKEFSLTTEGEIFLGYANVSSIEKALLAIKDKDTDYKSANIFSSNLGKNIPVTYALLVIVVIIVFIIYLTRYLN